MYQPPSFSVRWIVNRHQTCDTCNFHCFGNKNLTHLLRLLQHFCQPISITCTLSYSTDDTSGVPHAYFYCLLFPESSSCKRSVKSPYLPRPEFCIKQVFQVRKSITQVWCPKAIVLTDLESDMREIWNHFYG